MDIPKGFLMQNPAFPQDEPPFAGTHYLMGGMVLLPHEFTGWRDETMSWKEGAYISGNLNPFDTCRVKGPEALKFLESVCVNSFQNFPVGMGKHAIMCDEEGIITRDGVLIRTAEDEFITYAIYPHEAYYLSTTKYDAACENLTGRASFFQVAGPKSLTILEEAACEDLHDIKFMHHRGAKIAGHEVRILRMGMGGTLSYEVHCDFEHGHDVYHAIWHAGQPLGMRKLGMQAYMMNHTEDGFPQAMYHFIIKVESGLVQFCIDNQIMALPLVLTQLPYQLAGSLEKDLSLFYRNPVELGWAGMIKFDHEFTGRKALEKEVANPRRQMVTLEWNKEDIMDVYASQYQPGEPYTPMDRPNDFYYMSNFVFHADKVLNDKGDPIGISSGRSYSYKYREMISLCSINTPYAALGTEVYVLWGEPGTRQKKIRAKVARFPYLNEGRNQKFDVETIPHPGRK